MVREYPICPECSSDNVYRDSTSTWDIIEQDWVTMSVFDNGGCNDCEAEGITFEWVTRHDQVWPGYRFANVWHSGVNSDAAILIIGDMTELGYRVTDYFDFDYAK